MARVINDRVIVVPIAGPLGGDWVFMRGLIFGAIVGCRRQLSCTVGRTLRPSLFRLEASISNFIICMYHSSTTEAVISQRTCAQGLFIRIISYL